jgi:hypothetical protein
MKRSVGVPRSGGSWLWMTGGTSNAAAARVARIPQAPLARVGAHLHARLAPYTDLGTIAGELAVAHAGAARGGRG